MSSTKDKTSNEETSTDADGQQIHKEHVDHLDHYEHRRVSALDVRPSVAGIISDKDGNLDEKKAVAALSQTHAQNKHLWMAGFVLVGTVFVLIAANIGISVAVARLTRQLKVDPVTGVATIPGSDNVVMKTSTVSYKDTDTNAHKMPTKILSTYETIEFHDGDISFDVKGYARMSNKTIVLVEGGSLIFNINGLQNVTGDELTRVFSFMKDGKSMDLDGRKLNHDGTIHMNGGRTRSESCVHCEDLFSLGYSAHRVSECRLDYCCPEKWYCVGYVRPYEHDPSKDPCQQCGAYPADWLAHTGWPTDHPRLLNKQCCYNGMYVPASYAQHLDCGCAETIEEETKWA